MCLFTFLPIFLLDLLLLLSYGNSEYILDTSPLSNMFYECIFLKTFLWSYSLPIHVLNVFNYDKKYSCILSFFLVCFYLFWERERERERASTSRGGAEREGERIPSRLHSNSWTMRAWPELKSRVGCLTNWATCALSSKSLINLIFVFRSIVQYKLIFVYGMNYFLFPYEYLFVLGLFVEKTVLSSLKLFVTFLCHLSFFVTFLSLSPFLQVNFLY